MSILQPNDVTLQIQPLYRRRFRTSQVHGILEIMKIALVIYPSLKPQRIKYLS